MKSIPRQSTLVPNGNEKVRVASLAATTTITDARKAPLGFDAKQNDIIMYVKPIIIAGTVTGNTVCQMMYTNGEDGQPDSFYFRAIGNSQESNFEKHTKATFAACLKSAIRSHDLHVIESYKGLGKFLRDQVNP